MDAWKVGHLKPYLHSVSIRSLPFLKINLQALHVDVEAPNDQRPSGHIWSPRPTAASQGQNIPTRTREAG